MKILIYSFNDKIGDGLQKITFLQELKRIYPNSIIYYTTTQTTTLKNKLNPLIKNIVNKFIENNDIDSSFLSLLRKNNKITGIKFDLIIDLQKVVLRTLNLKKIPHKRFFSASANFLFSNFKNNNLKFKNIYIEQFYFNILSIIQDKVIDTIPSIEIPNNNFHFKVKGEKEKNIAIAPGAGNTIRQWKFNNYLKIAKKLRDRKFNVYFFLGPDEKELLEICLQNKFECPEWENGKLISKDITFIMNLAKKMHCLLCNDGGTAWMFEFAGIKSLKIFGVTDERKFSRPGFSQSIQVKDYGFKNLNDFPVTKYQEILDDFLKD
tara:strand:+ start:29 stop:991 length:963 start_codon:yes stop_codon:yes gene_type:complete